MSHFLIAQVKVNDDSWIPEYAEKVHGIVDKHGGKYLSRSANIVSIEGEAPDLSLVAIVEFPNLESLQAFVDDPEYAPFAKARQDNTNSQLFAIDSSDAAGTIPYLA